MNIFLFVITLLMLTATITYKRLEQFVASQVQAQQWVRLMQMDERDRYNSKILCSKQKTRKKLEKSTPAEQSTEESKPKTPPGYGQIYQGFLVDQEFREAHSEILPLYQEVLKNLIFILYADQPFYKDLNKRRPGFIDQFLSEIQSSAEAYKQKDKIKNIRNLLYASWSDPDFSNAFGLMMQEGLIYKGSSYSMDERNGNDESDESEPPSPKKARRNFQTLDDFITNKNSDGKIRVYLAPRELLLAIYQDPAMVSKIIETRESLYRDVKYHKKQPSEATKIFEEFKNSRYDPILDFTVTTTDIRGR
jgi:hypothetical protein